MSKLPIPEELLPDSFKDEQKLNALYAPIRKENLNAADRVMKLNFWKNMIHLYCSSTCEYSFSLSDIKRVFLKDLRSPACLDEVIKEMLKYEECQLLEDYFKATPNSWRLWFADMLLKSVSWPVKKVKDSVLGDDENSLYVDRLTVKDHALKLLSHISEKVKNKVITLNDILELSKKEFPNLTIENARILIHCLVVMGKADLRSQPGTDSPEILIKIYSSEMNPINDLDIEIYGLECKEKILQEQVEHLEDSVQELINEAKSCLKMGRKQMAKTHLRKKHEITKRLDKNVNALHNLQILLEKLYNCHTDKNVIESFRKAGESLKREYKTTDADNIAEMMIDLADVLDIQKEISQSLSNPCVEEEADIEKELEELLKEDTSESNISDLTTAHHTTGITDIVDKMTDLSITLPNKKPQVKVASSPV